MYYYNTLYRIISTCDKQGLKCKDLQCRRWRLAGPNGAKPTPEREEAVLPEQLKSTISKAAIYAFADWLGHEMGPDHIKWCCSTRNEER